MSNSASIDGYLHIEGYNNLPRDIFDKRKIRAGMRKAGRLVIHRAGQRIVSGVGLAEIPVTLVGEFLRSKNRIQAIGIGAGRKLVVAGEIGTENLQDHNPSLHLRTA